MSLRVALVSVLFFLSVPFLGADAPASRYIVFGETVACSSPVILRQGRLYVPLNESCQWLRVEANLQGETVTLRGRGGEARPPVAMSNGTRYVPAGALAEAASADIVWDAAQRTLVISGRLQDVFMEGSVLRLSLASPGKPPRWRIGRLHNPERLFIDLPGLRCVRLGSKEFAGSPVARIRTGQFKPEIARVVIELRQKASARWQPTEDPSLMEFLLEPETGRKRMEKPPRYSTEKPPAASNITKAPPKKSSIPAQVTNIRIESADESKARIWVETSGSARSKPFFLRNPVRLAVDVQNATLGALGSIDVPENPIVKGIRAAQFKTDVARIVLDLSRMVTFSVVSSSNPSGFWMELGMPEGSPGSLPGKTVVVDPGHGGKDTGTRGLSLRLLEKDINLDIALRLESLLRAAGVNVLLTRREDVFISLSDRVAFVTGGSRGIGAATASALARAGASVVVNYRQSKDAAERLCEQLRADGAHAFAAGADVRDELAVASAMDWTSDRFGRPVDILINNAIAPAAAQAFLGTDWTAIQSVFDVQVRGAFQCARAVLPKMIERKSGYIINVGSLMAAGSPAQQAALGIAKAAMKALTRSLAAEFGPQGVRVNMVSPGLTETESTAEVPERLRKLQAMQTPLRRLCRPEDVAQTILFLCSGGGDFITGADVPVGGGWGL